MTLLARKFTLGTGKETTPVANGVATYQAPTRFVPAASPKWEDVIAPLRDESLRGNDNVLQGIYGGPVHSTFEFSLPQLYPDVVGDLFRAIIGPDTPSGGTATTLSASTIAGATSISTAVSIPAGSTIRIDTTTKTEYAVTGAPTGSGPFTIPLTTVGNPISGTSTGLAFAHTSGVAVQMATLHTFAQDARVTAIPTYSLTMFDAIETRGFPGCIESDLSVKIDPKGAVTADPKWMGFPSAPQSNAAAAFSAAQPFLGWQWAMTLNGAASTRGLSGEWAFKRATDVIDASDGSQGPREVFPGALELDYKLKAIFENNLDYAQFLAYGALVIVNTLTQPLPFGGAVLTVTSSGQKFTKFTPDHSGTYLQADLEGSGAFNTTDSGVGTVTLLNFVATAY